MVLAPHEFSSRFWTVIAATFLGFLGIGAVLPGLGPHVHRDLGGSDRTVGFVVGIFSVVALSSRFIAGSVADRRGRKPAFLLGLASCSIAGLAYLLPIGIPGAYLGRALQGFGEACLYTGAATWVIELGGLHRSGQALGYLSSGIWGGISAGPVVGQWIGSFEAAAIFQAISAAFGFLLLLFVPEEYKVDRDPRSGKWMPPGLLLAGLSVGFVNVHYPVITAFLVLHLSHYGNSGPAAFSAYAAVILCARLFLGGLPDRLKPNALFHSGLACMAVGLIALAAGPSPKIAVAATGLLGFGFSFPWSCVATTILKRTAASDRGSVISALSAFYDAFVGASAFIAGFVADHFGYSAAFGMAAGSLVLAAILGNSLFTSMEDAPIPTETILAAPEVDVEQ